MNVNAEIEPTVANDFRREAQEARRLQLSAPTQADRDHAARQARYLENAARLLDDAMAEAGL